MKGIFLALVGAFALASANNDIAFNDAGCPLDVTITWLFPHEEKCDHFYTCMIGTPIPMKCGPTTAYDIEKLTCAHVADVDCGHRTLRDTEEKSEEVIVLPETEEVIVVLPEPTTRRPLFGYDDPSKAAEICAEEGSNDILISHEDCDKYYQCNWGQLLVRNCQTNLYYNPKIGGCDWLTNVQCRNPIVVDPNWTPQEKECNIGGRSLVPHQYCNWFYKCGPQGPTAISCELGLVFDYDWQTCNWPIFVNCGDKPIKPPTTEPTPITTPKPVSEEEPDSETEEEVVGVTTKLPDVIESDEAVDGVQTEQPAVVESDEAVDGVQTEQPEVVESEEAVVGVQTEQPVVVESEEVVDGVITVEP